MRVTQNLETFPRLDEEPVETPKWGDTSKKCCIFFRGNKMARGNMVHWKLDADGNHIGRSNGTPIFDTCFNEVKFHGGEIVELVAYITAELMYAQYNVNGSRYCILLESFVNKRKDDAALTMI